MKTDSVVVSVDRLKKCYGSFVAVQELSFDVRQGEIVGLVGANGAGKTSTLLSLAGLLPLDGGSIQVCGRCVCTDAVETKIRLAYIPDSNHPFDLLTVREHLRFVGLAHRVSELDRKVEAILAEVDLGGKADELASTLSRGMVQKLSLACALIWDPALVVLDEPLTGLDPRGIRAMKDLIRARAESGMAFLLSSHLLELVESLCSRVLILDRGKRLAFGSLDEIRATFDLADSASMEEVYLAMTAAS